MKEQKMTIVSKREERKRERLYKIRCVFSQAPGFHEGCSRFIKSILDASDWLDNKKKRVTSTKAKTLQKNV